MGKIYCDRMHFIYINLRSAGARRQPGHLLTQTQSAEAKKNSPKRSAMLEREKCKLLQSVVKLCFSSSCSASTIQLMVTPCGPFLHGMREKNGNFCSCSKRMMNKFTRSRTVENVLGEGGVLF